MGTNVPEGFVRDREQLHSSQPMFPQIFFLAEQNFSLLGGHFGHLSKNIFIPNLQSAHTKQCETFTLMCYFY